MRKMKDSGVAWIGKIPETWEDSYDIFSEIKNFFFNQMRFIIDH